MGIGERGAPRLLPGQAARRRALAACLVMGCTLGLLLRPCVAAAKQKKEIPRTISGRVFDSNDNGISGAEVELTDLQTGKEIAIFSDADGRYQFSDLSTVHDYQVRAKYKALASETRKASALGERTLVLNLHIPSPQN